MLCTACSQLAGHACGARVTVDQGCIIAHASAAQLTDAALLLPACQVAFIITMHNFVKGTAQGILELFRTAHEVPGAEFILVDDGSTEQDDTAMQTLLR